MTTSLEPRVYKLTPTNLSYQFHHCEACFRAIVREGWEPPPSKISAVFSQIDRSMRAAYENSNPADWSTLPAGILQTKEKQVISQVFSLAGFESKFYFSGRTDGLGYFADAHGVIDFKTLPLSKKKSFDQFYVDTIMTYAAQLYCYAWALENPADGKLHLPNVRHMGILAAVPAEVAMLAGSDILTLNRHWIPITRDDDWFRNFLARVLTVLDGPPISNHEACRACHDRRNAQIVEQMMATKAAEVIAPFAIT